MDNAFVALQVDNDEAIFLPQDPDRPGVYLTDTMRALFGKTYLLYVQHNNREYYSLNAPTFGSPVDPLRVELREDGLYEFIYEESAEPSMTEVVITWPNPDAANGGLNEILAYYYTLDVIDINKVFAPEKERIFFQPGATITRRKFSLNDQHQAFVRSFLAEVEWRGSIFDVAPGNVQTNIIGGAVGYFWVSMVRTDTQIVN